ncbi:MAG: prepilin-type N-terminal cleavage/methylation domain-containing protein [Actinomycetes bacterium]
MADPFHRTFRRTARDRGFTLIELLVVIVVIGVLAAIVVFGVARFRADSNEATDTANLTLLNRVSAAYDATAAAGQSLNDQVDDAARMNLLFDHKLLTGDGGGTNIVVAKVAGAAFVWDPVNQRWQYVVSSQGAAVSDTLTAAGQAFQDAKAATGSWPTTVPGSVAIPTGVVLEVARVSTPASADSVNFAAFLAACTPRPLATGSCAYLTPRTAYPNGAVEFKVQWVPNGPLYGPYHILPGQYVPNEADKNLQIAKIHAIGYFGSPFTLPATYDANPGQPSSTCVVGYATDNPTQQWHWDSDAGTVAAGGC